MEFTRPVYLFRYLPSTVRNSAGRLASLAENAATKPLASRLFQILRQFLNVGADKLGKIAKAIANTFRSANPTWFCSTRSLPKDFRENQNRLLVHL